MDKKLKELINSCTSEASLREIREYADSKLQKVKQSNAENAKEAIAQKYANKYLLIYGHCYDGPRRVINKSEQTIVYVRDIMFSGVGFFRCSAQTVTIKVDDECEAVKQLGSKDWGSYAVSFSDTDQFDVHEGEIAEILPPAQVTKIIDKAKRIHEKILDTWDR